ncbi:MAG: hypothetical protein JO257_20660 [Deltaproteobacteria bacterium]|nr:hypothetical protein [Deltaproteobacteria bacterium]
MKALAIVALLAATAHADDRCAAGLALAKQNDLPRAALYLEGCTGDDETRALADVAHKLTESTLSEIAIVTSPAGLPVTTTAMPGESITSPATVWAKAGTYDVTVTADNHTYTQTIVLQPHSRATALINIPAPKPQVVTDHTVTFDDNQSIEQHSGPPPDLKHPSLLPCKFANACTEAGDAIEDPLADKTYGPRDGATAPLRIGLRVGGGVAHVGSLAMSLGAAGVVRLSPSMAATARADWTRRESGMQGLDALALSAGVATPLATTDLAVLAAGLAARGELRFGDTFDNRAVHQAGLAADATVDLILRAMPIVVGARLSQGVTPLVASSRETAVLLELGLELR